jgi:hypothetical protein
MDSRNLWNIGPSALKSRVSNYSVIILSELKIKLPYFLILTFLSVCNISNCNMQHSKMFCLLGYSAV